MSGGDYGFCCDIEFFEDGWIRGVDIEVVDVDDFVVEIDVLILKICDICFDCDVFMN